MGGTGFGSYRQTIRNDGVLQSYTSAIDQSRQSYGLYVPASYANFPSHPVIFIGHGFSRDVQPSAAFSSYSKQFAEQNGVVLVNLYGRGNTFYDGIGEDDFTQVLTALRQAYAVDMTRLYFEGASMGATGAYRQGVRHPDLLAAVGGADGWGDYREWYSHWYGPTWDPTYVDLCRLPNLQMASCVDVAEGATWQHLFLIADTNDSTVWPWSTYNLHTRLTQLDDATPEIDYVHTLVTNNGGHCAGYDQAKLYPYFLSKTLTRNPTHVVVKTTRLKYGKQYWASIDRLLTANSFATLDVRVNRGKVLVTTSNVRQFTLAVTAIQVSFPVMSITINGRLSYFGRAIPVTMSAKLAADGQSTGAYSLTSPAHGRLKTAALEGPIGDAYTHPFTVVYGTSGDSVEQAQDLQEAQSFCNRWNSWMHAGITAHADSEILDDPTLSTGKNLILFGTEDSNLLLQALRGALPIVVAATGITIGNRHYSGTRYGAYFIFPNPTDAGTYVVVSHNTVPGSAEKDLEALPWYWPDYVIFDAQWPAQASIQASLNYLPDSFIEAGYFDGEWKLRRPDVALGVDAAHLVGVDQFDIRGKQAVRQVAGSGGAHYTCVVRNAGVDDDRYLLTATADSTGTVTIMDQATGANVTASVLSAAGLPVSCAAGATRVFDIIVVPTATLVAGAAHSAVFTVVSSADAVAADRVQAITTR